MTSLYRKHSYEAVGTSFFTIAQRVTIATPLATTVIHQKAFHSNARIPILVAKKKSTETDFKFLTYRNSKTRLPFMFQETSTVRRTKLLPFHARADRRDALLTLLVAGQHLVQYCTYPYSVPVRYVHTYSSRRTLALLLE